MTLKLKAASGLIFLLLAFCLSLYLPFPGSKLKPGPVVSLQILDRNNNLLREVLSREGGRCTWVSLKDISPLLVAATVAAEDKNFFHHPGIDVLALGRAVYLNIKHRRIISGASTITQQLVRNIYHKKRTLLTKIVEAWNALRLEKKLSKEDILIQYLNRISYGNQAFGIEAAAKLYFDKRAADLSLAESAFLAGLPRSPSILNPYRNLSGARKRQGEVLRQIFDLGFIKKQDLDRSLSEPLNILSENIKFRAPHFCDYILTRIPNNDQALTGSIHTTLDYNLQYKIEKLAVNHIDSLIRKNITNVSVVVMENSSGDIQAMLGSKDFFDFSIDGQVNGATSLRQPGSTLKPFTYALALDSGMTAASILEDEEIQFQTPTGSYMPQNYDKKFHGPVRLRKALACSYNIPAVSVLEKIGTDRLYLKLHEAGFASLQKRPGHYGIGLTLGNGEVTLLELVQAYSTLSRQGSYLPSRSITHLKGINKAEPEEPGRSYSKKIFSAQSAYILTHILSDSDARIPSFGYNSPLNLPFPCASKTGTSKDFRDNWTIGFTTQYTVGVWVGNFDGQPMHNVSGITGCGPLYRDIMLLLHKNTSKIEFSRPDRIVTASICSVSGQLAADNCPGSIIEVFAEGNSPSQFCEIHGDLSLSNQNHPALEDIRFFNNILSVTFPVHGDVFKLDPILRKEYQMMKLRAKVRKGFGIKKIEWWLNGKKIGVSSSPHSVSWKLKPGYYKIHVRTVKEKQIIKSKTIDFRVLS